MSAAEVQMHDTNSHATMHTKSITTPLRPLKTLKIRSGPRARTVRVHKKPAEYNRQKLSRPARSHIRIQFQETPEFRKAIRNVLVPKKEIKIPSREGTRQMRRRRISELVDLHKERLRIRCGVDYRNDEMTRIRELIEKNVAKIVDQEKLIANRISDFDDYVKMNNDSAGRALMEAEGWTKRRHKLNQPAIALKRSIRALTAENIELEARLEMSTEMHDFVITLYHNSINSFKLESSYKPVQTSWFLDLQKFLKNLTLKEVIGQGFVMEEFVKDEGEMKVRRDSWNPRDLLNEVYDTESGSINLIDFWETSKDELKAITVSTCQAVKKFDHQLEVLKSDIENCTNQISRYEDRIKELELWCRLFSHGDDNGLFNGDDDLRTYQRTVRRIYNDMTGSSTMKIEVDTLVMLTMVETHLINLIMEEEVMEPKRVSVAVSLIKAQRLAEEAARKNNELEKLRAARNLKAIMRSNQVQKVTKTRKLMKRSEPYVKNKSIQAGKVTTKTENNDDEMHYFIS